MKFSITEQRWNNAIGIAAPVLLSGIAVAAVLTSKAPSPSESGAQVSTPTSIERVAPTDIATNYRGSCGMAGGVHFQFTTEGPKGASVTNFDATAITQLSSFRGREEYLVSKITEQVLPPSREQADKALTDLIKGTAAQIRCV